MGTVEPIFNKDEDRGDKVAFIRGFLQKYQNANLSKRVIWDYLKTVVK